MSTVALIVAAGRGTRAGGEAGRPKQYRRIGRECVLTRSLRAFLGHPRVHRTLAVIHTSDRPLYDEAVQGFGDDYAAELLAPVAGGDTRQDSARAGLEALAVCPPRHVLIHDAARPFVSGAVIDGVLDALDLHAGAVPAVALADTLKRATAGLVDETVERAGLWRAQTPQGFRFSEILAAHRRARAAGRGDLTDDAAIAEWHGLEVAITPGSEANRKLTTPEDLAMAERDGLLGEGGALPADIRTGSGLDVHRFGAEDQEAPGYVTLCGVQIPFCRSLEGHSDADVGLHALTDALFGALADGDIGTHFPPNEDKWRDASSAVFLADAAARLRARGGILSHVDITLICEMPRIRPHRGAMRERVADILTISSGRVSVKATTTEGLGFTGRAEGIAAMATVTVRLPLAYGM